MNEGLVSIIIPAYNQAQYLSFAIESVLSQAYPQWECIVVDDGSTDDTKKITHHYNHKAIRYIYQRNQGLSAARNTGITAAQGEFLAFLDSDDMLLPEHLQLLVTAMRANPTAALMHGSSIVIDQNNRILPNTLKSGLSGETNQLLFENPIQVDSVLLRHSWQEKIGLFDTNLRSYEDWDYWLRLAAAGASMASIPDAVFYYRFHSQQMTKNTTQMTSASFAVLDKVFNNQDIPASWLKDKNTAYSHAHLRGAANAYLSDQIESAQQHLLNACQLNPQLLAENEEMLIKKTYGWADSPKVKDPIRFLDNIYSHLPAEIDRAFTRTKKDILAEYVIQKAFALYQQEDYAQCRFYVLKGLGLHKKWIFNRGVLRILLTSTRKLVIINAL